MTKREEREREKEKKERDAESFLREREREEGEVRRMSGVHGQNLMIKGLRICE